MLAPDFALWEAELARVGYCANPIHLRGSITHVDRTTGEARQLYSTDTRPGGTLRIRCGTRLAAKCPACAWTYQQDAFHLLRAGLTGDQTKHIPATVATHPRLFVTLTAPSFGEVHTHNTTATGRIRPCHPRDSGAAYCPHGRRMDCRFRHPKDDPRLGEPLCAGCYDYQRAVAFNTLAPELWRRTIEYTYRHLADVLGVSQTAARRLVRISYAKVAEWQTRGAIHFHAIIRLDGIDPLDPDRIIPPPVGLTADHLTTAITTAAATVPPPDQAKLIRWGTEHDLHPLTAQRRPGGPVTAEQVAGYVAKYATKHAADTFGAHLHHRITNPDQLYRATLRARPHVARLLETAWQLGRHRYAHTFGFGGHFLTKSRRYATTFTAARRARIHHARAARAGAGGIELDAWDRPLTDDRVLVLAEWTYERSGHRGSVERWLALAAAARAREHRRTRAGFPTRTAA